MHSRRYRRRKVKKILFLILTLFLIGGIFYFLFFSEVFKFKNFAISGVRSLDSEEIKETIEFLLEGRWLLIPANNFFIVKEQALEAAILSKFKRIEEIKIKKKLPNIFALHRASAGLKIEIGEKNLNLIWCERKIEVSESTPGEEGEEEKRCFYLDKDGMIFGKTFDIDLENLDEEKLVNTPFILVEEEKDDFSNLEERVATPEIVDFVLQIKLILPKITGLKMVKGSILLASAGQINIETEEGWEVYFDTTRGLTSQVKILDLVLTEKITKEEREVLEYIDLRVPGRIYYK